MDQKKKKEQLNKLKIKSKSVHDEVTRINYHLLKNVIKDFYGNKEFERCINEVIERGKAYKISNTMGIENYTHSKGTIIKKVGGQMKISKELAKVFAESIDLLESELNKNSY